MNKIFIDKFNRTYPQIQDRVSEPRAALPDNVVICKNDGFFCNNKKIEIAVNDKDHPFVSVNDKYISGLQQYGGKPFKADRWVFCYKGYLLPYKDNHLMGMVDGYIGLTDRVVPDAWDPFAD